ncbi:hypothetical protein KKF34_14365 [Myxococcota bacterium]|nr:hypothetical protein [Myxococcota bacterium]MBU1380714.1 hypothetical protein [Myxococcota bacterium]MBU1498058.1 hypothetical protein [Myxococcota bacterium]
MKMDETPENTPPVTTAADDAIPKESGPATHPETDDPSRKDGLTGLMGDILSRVVSVGEGSFKKATDMRIPKELISYGKEQIGSLRKDVVTIVGREMNSFLKSINLGQEMLNLLTYLTFEVKMQIRLLPSERGGLEIKPKTEVRVVETNDEDKGK